MSDKPQPRWEEHAAKALNEQGFLFQQRVREEMRLGFEEHRHKWVLEGMEYPVSAANERQTKIDLVLAHGQHRGVHLAVECKRAHPDYKASLFFDTTHLGRSNSTRECLLEAVRLKQRPIKDFNTVTRRIDKYTMGSREAFNYYLECKLGRDGKSSSTDTIEDAFVQVMLGHSGLMKKLFAMDSHFFARSIPVVLTTAQLFEAKFDVQKVSLREGFIKSSDLELKPLDFAPVHYHAADDLSLAPLTAVFSRPDITSDLTQWQTRTIFVVQASCVVDFLGWAGQHLTEDEL